MADHSACPSCGDRGRKVTQTTTRALLTDAAAALGGELQLRFCRRSACDVVYFGEGVVFSTVDVRVPVFQKSDAPDRPVCYCFGHTMEAIAEEVRTTGRSAVPDLIAEKCRQGLDRCEERNPQGACCLGNVRQVVASVGGAASDEPASGACCPPAETGGASDEPASDAC